MTNFEDLPTDILCIICDYLSYEYTDDEDADDEDADDEDADDDDADDEDAADENDDNQNLEHSSVVKNTRSSTQPKIENMRRSLLDLCLVSRNLYAIAQPYLYHFFNQKRDKILPFLRHIIKKPSHAVYVRSLRIEPLEQGWGWKPLEKGIDLECLSVLLCSMIHRATIVSGNFPSSLAFHIDLTDPKVQQEIVAQWLILNLTSLRLIKISVDSLWEFGFLRHIALYDNSLFSRLQTLFVLGPPKWQLVWSTVNLGLLAPLIRSKHLTEIALDHCVQTDVDRTMARRIAHWNCGDIDCQIYHLLSTCTQLDEFELEHFSGTALDLSALSASRSSLQKLSLDLSGFSLNRFNHFENLREVTIIAPGIDPRPPGKTATMYRRVILGRDATAPGTILAVLLPSSLEYLRLGTHEDETEVWQKQLEGIIAHVKKKFRVLKRVEISWQPHEKLKTICALADVHLEMFDVT